MLFFPPFGRHRWSRLSIPLFAAAVLACSSALPSRLEAQPQPGGAIAATPAPADILIQTAHTSWVMRHDQDGHLTQLYYGASAELPVDYPVDARNPPPPVYPAYGDGYILEPALRAVHADGNTSTDLQFVSAETEKKDGDVAVTRVQLRDPAYPFFVTLCFRAYREQDVIEQWAEIRHDEPAAVVLYHFASAALALPKGDIYATTFQGDWADEMRPVEDKLTPGIKIVDSKIGVRADEFAQPSFFLAIGAPAKEEAGKVIAGTLEWSGSFQFAFENHTGQVRALCGINPFASQYHLERGETFTTPAMAWCYSDAGKGPLSRQLHRWARRYALRDGGQPRAVLLNNWEATGFHFDEQKLTSLFDGARAAGMELFLLDDGWFGNNHPRDNDDAGLGDWQVSRQKLPRGLTYLTEEARKRGLRFGLWFEPEMVNPQSDLFEAHPDWAIQQPHRPLELERNQLNLDLTRPEVREFAFHVLDDALTQNPGISYIKWDCNRHVTQPGSTYLDPAHQSHLWIAYVRAQNDIMQRVAERHPAVEMMLCSAGGGRVNYGALRYFHEFWPSDNTDPARRIPMQWNYSYFYPVMAQAGHVTRMGERPLKFACDVAMSVRLGFDLDLAKCRPVELKFIAASVALYKRELRDVVQQGDLYRLEAPGEGPRTALAYVSPDLSQAALFVYQTGDAVAPAPVRPAGLDARRRYLVREVNLPEGQASALLENGQTIDGATLMSAGLTLSCHRAYESAVLKLTEVADDRTGGGK